MTALQPLPGDFGLVGGRYGSPIDRLAHWAIRLGTDSTVNHAFLYIGDGLIVEAESRVRVAPVTEYRGITWSAGRLGRLTPDHAQRRAIAAAARSYAGQPYNWADIVAIALAQRRLGRLVDGDERWVRRISADPRPICSELVDRAYLKAGIHLFSDGRLPGLVSPADLLALLAPEPA